MKVEAWSPDEGVEATEDDPIVWVVQGDGSHVVCLYADELAELVEWAGARRPLRVETYRSVEGMSTKHHEFRWRVVHASNGETMASGEGYVDGRDRDHAVKVLFPGVEIVEVES